MGLEIVELFMRVEEEFDIFIEDEEASHIETVGQLHTLILDKTGLLVPTRCPSRATFYQLRRALVDLAVAPRQAIAPTTATAALLPASMRRQIWKEWGRAAQVKLPDLEKPGWARALCWLAVAASLTIGSFFWIHATSLIFWYYATAFVLCYLTYRWSERHAIELPASCVSVGEATKAVMKLNYGINLDWDKSQGSDDIWDKLKAIVAEEADVAPDAVTPDAQFVRDLRMG